MQQGYKLHKAARERMTNCGSQPLPLPLPLDANVASIGFSNGGTVESMGRGRMKEREREQQTDAKPAH